MERACNRTAVTAVIWSLPHMGMYDPSFDILVSVIVFAMIGWIAIKVGIVRLVVGLLSKIVRKFVHAGFLLWKQTLVWALWPFFLLTVAAALGLDWLTADHWPVIGIVSGAALLYMGVVTCLAYMFIDLERYEVGRGYKALHNPLKGQALALPSSATVTRLARRCCS